MKVRQATVADACGMAAVLNAVISLGGTTAHLSPKSETVVRHQCIDGPDVLSSVVVEEAGEVIGWQSVGLWHQDPHIGSFVRPGLQAKGVGSAMFALTCDQLRDRGVAYIIAFVRSDNAPGLAYYARIGFRDIGSDPDFALTDGRVVGRVHRRFDL